MKNTYKYIIPSGFWEVTVFFYNHNIPLGLIVRPKSRRDVMIIATKMENQAEPCRDEIIKTKTIKIL